MVCPLFKIGPVRPAHARPVLRRRISKPSPQPSHRTKSRPGQAKFQPRWSSRPGFSLLTPGTASQKKECNDMSDGPGAIDRSNWEIATKSQYPASQRRGGQAEPLEIVFFRRKNKKLKWGNSSLPCLVWNEEEMGETEEWGHRGSLGCCELSIGPRESVLAPDVTSPPSKLTWGLERYK